MAWFGQGRDTIEWEEYRPDLLFYKWKNKEIKEGSKLIIRAGQKAIFYANGAVEGIFEEEGEFDIDSQIVPFLSTFSGLSSLRGDSGLRAEVYFVNAKEMMILWGTRQRIMIPTPEVPSGIPVGCNGNMIIEFRDYLTFIQKVAGIKSSYSLSDISERVVSEMNSILPEVILSGHQMIGMHALAQLQRNQRQYGKRIAEELDKELFDIGLGVRDVNINAFSYPPEIQEMVEKVAAQSFVQDLGKYTQISVTDSMQDGQNTSVAGMAAQAALGLEVGQQMIGNMKKSNEEKAAGTYTCKECGNICQLPAKFCSQCGAPIKIEKKLQTTSQEERFCTECRKMVNGKFCPDCGTPTV